MGMGIEEEASSAAAPTPQKPSFNRPGSTRFHLATIRAKNSFKRCPFPSPNPSHYKGSLYESLHRPHVLDGFLARFAGNERIERKDSKRGRGYVCLACRSWPNANQ